MTDDVFFVAQVRILNELGRDDPASQRSILAYAASIESAISLDKRCDLDAVPGQARPRRSFARAPGSDAEMDFRTCATKYKNDWFPLEPADTWIPGFERVTWQNAENPAQSMHFTSSTAPDSTGHVHAAKGGEGHKERIVLRYRPLTYDQVLASFDARDARTKTSRWLRALDFVGKVAAALSLGAGDFLVGPDFPKGAALFTSVRMGLEDWLKKLSALQRQNLVTQSFKPLEEIPPGADLTRVVFFPKGEIQGVLAGHVVRISEIHTSFFRITVGVIDKKQRVGSE